MASSTTGFATRFGDGPLSFGLKRFEDSDKNALWRFRVSRYIGGSHGIEQDANATELREMIAFLEKAIEAIRTDGGRVDRKDEP